jgi:copper homeostasis protein
MMAENTLKLEIIATSVKEAMLAEKAGADRIELVENLPEGGITPSYGMIAGAMNRVQIPVFPMIRPRGGDFVYDEWEFETMCRDVSNCWRLGCRGIVTGILQADGRIDEERCKQMMALAGKMQLTFHRAFDATPDPLEALETLIRLGFHRILTSGHSPSAEQGQFLLAELVQRAAGSIIIMPGGGVRETNLLSLRNTTKAAEFHSSGRNKDERFVNETMVGEMKKVMSYEL